MNNFSYNSHSSIGSLLRSVSRQALQEAAQQAIFARAHGIPQSLGYMAARGHHVYAELRLTKKLSAPENTADAAACSRAIIATTQVCDRCVVEEGGRILEAQGEIIHAFLPTSGNRKIDDQRLLRFAKATTQIVYKIIKPICGDGWGGFAMAADFGEALILTTTTKTQSVISLGACANRPAKKLAIGVPSGTLSSRDENGHWIEVNLIDRATDTDEDRAKFARYQTLVSNIITETKSISVNFANNYDKQAAEWIAGKSPTVLYGHVLRADLDGFSVRVEKAFADRNQELALTTLAAEFNILVHRAESAFQTYHGSEKFLLPWAGDCLNGIVFPSFGENFGDAQSKLPATFGSHWHGEFQGQGTDKWTLGIAGGDADDCSPVVNGRVLITSVSTDSRDFQIAVGWGCGMSLRAQEAKGARADDTVIPVEDYRQLDPIYQDLFVSLPDTRYYKAPALTPNKLRDAVREKGRASVSSNPAIPLARPWYDIRRHA
jgi:hypothetical protein